MYTEVAAWLLCCRTALLESGLELASSGKCPNGVTDEAHLVERRLMEINATLVRPDFVHGSAEEAGASRAHQKAVTTAGPNDTIRTIICQCHFTAKTGSRRPPPDDAINFQRVSCLLTGLNAPFPLANSHWKTASSAKDRLHHGLGEQQAEGDQGAHFKGSPPSRNGARGSIKQVRTFREWQMQLGQLLLLLQVESGEIG